MDNRLIFTNYELMICRLVSPVSKCQVFPCGIYLFICDLCRYCGGAFSLD